MNARVVAPRVVAPPAARGVAEWQAAPEEAPSMEQDLQQEVENFILTNELNEKAAGAMRSVPAAIQRYVMELGPLDGCRSRSAGCLGRIHKAQSGGGPVSTVPAGPPQVQHFFVPVEELEAFIISNALNERSAQALRTVPPAVQRIVVDLGSLLSCRDPSAGCLGRIRDIQNGKISLTAATVLSDLQGGELQAEVERFIAEHELNERSATALRGVGPMVQRQVLDLGSLNGCRDPSAGCLGRLQKIQNGTLQPRAARADMTMMAGMAGMAGQQMIHPMGMDVVPVTVAVEEIEEFIIGNMLNERASNAMRTVPPAVQRAVLDLGSLQGCRDPSAGCLGRIHKFQTGQAAAPDHRPAVAVAVDPLEVEQFISMNVLDERAANALRGSSPTIQRQVMDLGSLAGCRDPSAGCLGRINRAHNGLPPAGAWPQTPSHPSALGGGRMAMAMMGVVAPTEEEIEVFIAENQLPERGATALRTVAPFVQRQVLDLGSLLSCRDPTAGLIGRIRDAQNGKVPTGPHSRAGKQAMQMQAGVGMEGEDLASLQVEVEVFIAEHELNEKATTALRSVGPAVQRQVLDMGSLQGCRSASAGCLGRIQKIQSQMGAGGNGGGPYNPWGGGLPTPEEVEQFIYTNELNEKAANAIRTAGPAVQRRVMELGALQSCREPSAGCLGRIRDYQSGPTLMPGQALLYPAAAAYGGQAPMQMQIQGQKGRYSPY